MLYDLRAKLSEVSSAAKKRQADAAAREASLEESLQLAQQRLAEEKHRAAKSLEDQSRSRAALATEQAALASTSAAKEAALERCLIDERKQRMRAEDREQAERAARAHAEAELAHAVERGRAEMKARLLEAQPLNAAAAREQAAETARAAVDVELVEVRTALRLETSKLIEARTMLESTAAELKGRLSALETAATRGELLAERLAEAEARLAENAAALHARHADVDEMGRELTDTNAKLVAAVQSAADAQRERSAIQEKLDTALLEAAEARHAVATLVLREVSVVSGAAGRSNGRSGGSYPGGSAQEEADGQRLRAALVRQEAEREMAAALEREGKLKERVQAVLGETVLLKGERDLARAEAAEAKRRAAELEQLAAEERMHAAKAQYSLSTREAELQAAREQAENSAAARVVEAVAT
ncbi:hypothetical protein Ctob_010245, partial [Chrysochromulina tobinii]